MSYSLIETLRLRPSDVAPAHYVEGVLLVGDHVDSPSMMMVLVYTGSPRERARPSVLFWRNGVCLLLLARGSRAPLSSLS